MRINSPVSFTGTVKLYEGDAFCHHSPLNVAKLIESDIHPEHRKMVVDFLDSTQKLMEKVSPEGANLALSFTLENSSRNAEKDKQIGIFLANNRDRDTHRAKLLYDKYKGEGSRKPTDEETEELKRFLDKEKTKLVNYAFWCKGNEDTGHAGYCQDYYRLTPAEKATFEAIC